jgi:predicted amidohydrolase YtcJ
MLRAALAHCSRLGITSADTFERDPDLFDELADLERRGELPLRLRVSLPLAGALDRYASLRERVSSERLAFGYLKGFVDGVIESKTAYLLAPYAGEESLRGEPRIAPARLEEQVRAAHARDFPVALHAIGDAAVRLSLDTFERVQRSDPRPKLHHRVEHIELIDPADLPRFAALGVVASMQPFHANPFGDSPDEGVWSRNLGARRLPLTFPWRMLHAAGAPLVFGSDWPVMSADPLQGLAVALTRRDDRGRPEAGWNAHQTLDLEAALSAWAGLEVGGLPRGGAGRLRPGMPADLVVLAPGVDPVRPATLWHGERVRHVVVAGEVVHSAPQPAASP